jgi:hypothetical protein
VDSSATGGRISVDGYKVEAFPGCAGADAGQIGGGFACGGMPVVADRQWVWCVFGGAHDNVPPSLL